MSTSASPGTKAAFESTPDKPEAVPVRPDGIPMELRLRDHWVAWKYELRDGRWTKVPIDPVTGRKAKANDPTTWGTFDEALAYHRSRPDTTDGVGYEFSATDPFCGVDLDDAIDPGTGEAKPWAEAIVNEFGTYAETSPSRTGLKLYCRAAKPGDKCKAKYEDGEVEMYDRRRFFAMTGDRQDGTPPTVEECQAAVDRLYDLVFGAPPPTKARRPAGQTKGGPSARDMSDDDVVAVIERAKNGAKFRKLMAGDTGDYGGDDSRADSALCCMLAFVTRDPHQIERIFNRSQLADRNKWRDRPSYRDQTIVRALDLVTQQYTPRGQRSANGKRATNGNGSAGVNPEAAGKTSDVSLGPLTLRPGQGRRTAGGAVKVNVLAYLKAEVVYDFLLSASPQAWKQHAGMLEQIAEGLPDRKDIFRTFAAIVAAAGRQADAPPADDGPTIESVVKALAPPRWRFTARTPKGTAISEARGHDVTRAEFIGCVDDELMAACGEASDAPQDSGGRVSRPDLLRLIQTELTVLWATLMRTLPPLADADLAPASTAGKAFREAMARLWTATRTFEVAKTMAGAAGESVASRASLVSRVRHQAKDYLCGNVSPQPREKWRPIQQAFDAWWRPYVVPGDGRLSVLLAMRWSVTGQIGVELPGVTDQDSLTHLGDRFGCMDRNPPVRGVLSGGSTRLAVLSLSMTEELLEMPQDEDQENSDADPVTPDECN